MSPDLNMQNNRQTYGRSKNSGQKYIEHYQKIVNSLVCNILIGIKKRDNLELSRIRDRLKSCNKNTAVMKNERMA